MRSRFGLNSSARGGLRTGVTNDLPSIRSRSTNRGAIRATTGNRGAKSVNGPRRGGFGSVSSSAPRGRIVGIGGVDITASQRAGRIVGTSPWSQERSGRGKITLNRPSAAKGTGGGLGSGVTPVATPGRVGLPTGTGPGAGGLDTARQRIDRSVLRSGVGVVTPPPINPVPAPPTPLDPTGTVGGIIGVSSGSAGLYYGGGWGYGHGYGFGFGLGFGYGYCHDYGYYGHGYRHCHYRFSRYRGYYGHRRYRLGGYYPYLYLGFPLGYFDYPCYRGGDTYVIYPGSQDEVVPEVEDKSLSLKPGEIAFCEGWVLLKSGDSKQAAESFYDSSYAIPASGLVHYFMALALAAEGEIELATAALTEAHELNLGVFAYSGDLALLYGSAERVDAVRAQVAEFVATSPDRSEGWLLQSALQLYSVQSAEDLLEAKRSVSQAVPLDVANPLAAALLGEIDRRESGQPAEDPRLLPDPNVQQWLANPGCEHVRSLNLGGN